jgi:hypothetical protein
VVQRLQQLKPPGDMLDLLAAYEFCGYQLEELELLFSALVDNRAEREGDCCALTLVLAAAKETGDVKVCCRQQLKCVA